MTKALRISTNDHYMKRYANLVFMLVNYKSEVNYANK